MIYLECICLSFISCVFGISVGILYVYFVDNVWLADDVAHFGDKDHTMIHGCSENDPNLLSPGICRSHHEESSWEQIGNHYYSPFIPCELTFCEFTWFQNFYGCCCDTWAATFPYFSSRFKVV